MIKQLIKQVLGIQKPPFVKNPRFPAYWWGRVLGGDEAQIVQIGSNDGKTGDPLHELLLTQQAWRALLVEPLPDLCTRLRANYPKEDRFQIAQAAVNQGEDQVDAPAAKAAIPDLPVWFDQLGSFDRGHIVKELNGVLEPYIKSCSVNGRTLPALLAEYAIETIDILHIDAEGYDWKVLSQLDLNRFSPAFILYEHHHLAAEEFAAAVAFLTDRYHLFKVNIDILAVNRQLGEDLIGQMREHLQTI